MSANQSSLEAGRYGYDVVVATTQLSINSTMKPYFSELTAPVVTMCYVEDPANPKTVSYDQLLELTHGVDPFEVPDGTDPQSKELWSVAAAGFVYGFRLQIGLPLLDDPGSTPDIVKLGVSAANVTFYLLSAELDLVGFSGDAKPTWTNVSQPYGSPWVFTSVADLRLEDVPPGSYGTLPEPVQQTIKDLSGTAFSIQQLLLDLSTAILVAIPDIKGLASPITFMLKNYFLAVYMNQLQAAAGGNLVLGCAIKQQAPSAATMTITDMSLEVSPVTAPDGSPVTNPTKAQQDLTTLNYLCATDNHKLPPPEPFTWNWIDDAEKTSDSGVVAINRLSFVQKIQEQMLPNVIANCYKPYVRVQIVWYSGQADITMNVTPGGQPTINQSPVPTGIPGRDLQVLKFTFHGHDEDAGTPSFNGTASLDTYYDATVYFSGSNFPKARITVEQNQKFDMRVTRLGATTTGSPVVIKRVDTCDIVVDDYGHLIANMATPVPAENHATQDATSFWGDMYGGSNSLYANTASIVAGTGGTMLNSLPFTVFQYFVFPGGQTFSYKEVAFAQIGDMVSHIVYADPDGVTPDMSLLPGQVQGGNQLNDGQWLANNGYLVSPNGKYAVILQNDGNLVLVHANNGNPDLGRPYWSVFANSTNKIVGKFTGIPCFLSMQSDGNLVLYNSKSPVSSGPPYWAINSGLSKLDTFMALMQDDANFCVYHRVGEDTQGDPVWDAGIHSIPKE